MGVSSPQGLQLIAEAVRRSFPQDLLKTQHFAGFGTRRRYTELFLAIVPSPVRSTATASNWFA